MKRLLDISRALLLCVLFGCCAGGAEQKTSPLRFALVDYGGYTTDGQYIYSGSRLCFFPVRMANGKGNDTIVNVVCGESFYHDVNMRFCDYRTFSESLIETLEEDGCLTVDSAYFEKAREAAVTAAPDIRSLYREKGIEGVLQKYISRDGYILPVGGHKEQDYLIYLLYQHHIMCCLEHIPVAMSVHFDYADNAKEYKKIISGNKYCLPRK